jgi:multiple sugar transport system ATP-binding protein
MAQVTLHKVVKNYDDTPAVRGIDLDIADKEFVVLVGPSGCGKSTTLRMIAGLEDITDGEILIGGEVVNDTPPKDRDIAMVFQNYALYPHMTVFDNMAFSLTLAKAPRAVMEQEVNRAAKILGLEQLLQRFPRQLSGGQRQRVAMGRAIVRDPKAFLMDEPLSNLDAKLRVQTRTQIASLQRRLGVTTVYVTHDQVEAMTMGDRVCVLKDGLLMQVGTPRELYDHPTNVFVAGFIGSPAMNLLELPVADGGVKLGDAVYPVERSVLSGAGNRVTVGVRPEDLKLSDRGLAVQVDVVEELGADAYIYGRAARESGVSAAPGSETALGGDLQIIARTDGRRPPEKGSTIHFVPEQGHVHLFDTESGQRLGG